MYILRKVKRENDMRVLRTKKSLRDAFKELLCEMDYEQITIQDLTDRAMINRKTFYLHYPSLASLLWEVQDEMAANFIKRTEGMERPRDMDKVTREFFLYSEELGKLGEKLNCCGNYLSQRITDEIMRQTWGRSQENPHLQRIVMAFVSQATLTIYRQWIADSKKIPLEDIIELTTQLICRGVNSLPPQRGKA